MLKLSNKINQIFNGRSTVKLLPQNLKKTFKKMFKILKGEKCLKRGAHVGGNHGDEYMPQFINFFKKNLL